MENNKITEQHKRLYAILNNPGFLDYLKNDKPLSKELEESMIQASQLATSILHKQAKEIEAKRQKE